MARTNHSVKLAEREVRFSVHPFPSFSIFYSLTSFTVFSPCSHPISLSTHTQSECQIHGTNERRHAGVRFQL